MKEYTHLMTTEQSSVQKGANLWKLQLHSCLEWLCRQSCSICAGSDSNLAS